MSASYNELLEEKGDQKKKDNKAAPLAK